jgi:hypothetical protein
VQRVAKALVDCVGGYAASSARCVPNAKRTFGCKSYSLMPRIKVSLVLMRDIQGPLLPPLLDIAMCQRSALQMLPWHPST